jgi:hypothetical protein
VTLSLRDVEKSPTFDDRRAEPSVGRECSTDGREVKLFEVTVVVVVVFRFDENDVRLFEIGGFVRWFLSTFCFASPLFDTMSDTFF